MAAMRDAARRAGAGRRRRRVRLPRRPRSRRRPAWMQRLGLEWAFRLAAGAAPAVAALPALQPALRGRLRAPVRAPAPRRARVASLQRAMRYDVCRHRPRPRRPAARALASPTRPARARRRQRPGRARGACATGRMPFKEPGAEELLDRVRASIASADRRVADAARGRRTIVLTLGTPALLAHRDRHARHPLGARRPAAACCATGQLLVLRSTVAPGTTEFVAGYLEKHRGFAGRRGRLRRPRARAHRRRPLPGGDRHAAVHRRRRRRGARASAPRELFERFGAPIVQTTPVQAELAKIWTNILRYTTFALPNLLMMDCEQYGANVFEVIDLINRDYPRGGMAPAGPDRGDLPAQGLRVLRGALERAGHAARRLARQRDRAAVPRRGHEAPPRRAAGRKVAVLGLAFKARHRRRARLALPQAHPAARARAGRRRDPRPARGDADAVASRTRCATPTRSSWRPTTREFRSPEPLARIAERARAATALVVDPWNCFGAAQVFALRRARSQRAHARREPGPRHRRRRHDRRGGRAPAAARPRLRGPRLRPARGAGVDARGLRGPPAATCATSPRRARRPRAARTSSTWRRSSAASRNFHKLPLTLTEVNNALYNGVVARGARRGVERFVYVSSSMVFERATQFPTTEAAHLATARCRARAYGFSKLAGEVYCRAAHDEHGPALHDLPPVQRLRARRDARGRARDRPHGPRPHPASAWRCPTARRCRSSAPASRRGR